jgi:predicted O-methyltransferase YrrM
VATGLQRLLERCIGRVLRRRRNETEGRPAEVSPFLKFAPCGHFYSPIPSPEDIKRCERPVAYLPDIELNEEDQGRLLLEISRYYPELPFQEAKDPTRRYYFGQPWYCYADAIYLYSLIRHFQPKRYLEVGCGFSSSAALDTSDLFLDGKVRFTFIEPYPDRLNELLTKEDRSRCQLHRKPVQEVSLETFDELEANDILFIDSSHVSKVGSDVNHLMFHVFPRLKPGVLIHLHDIFYPFEYPESWFREGRAWNEAYLVRAFLQNNDDYRIVLFSSYVARQFRTLLEKHMPLCLQNTGGALWLRKVTT